MQNGRHKAHKYQLVNHLLGSNAALYNKNNVKHLSQINRTGQHGKVKNHTREQIHTIFKKIHLIPDANNGEISFFFC